MAHPNAQLGGPLAFTRLFLMVADQGTGGHRALAVDRAGGVKQSLEEMGFAAVIRAGDHRASGTGLGGAGLGRLAHGLDLLHWRREATREF